VPDRIVSKRRGLGGLGRSKKGERRVKLVAPSCQGRGLGLFGHPGREGCVEERLMNIGRLLGLSVAVTGLLGTVGCSNALKGDWRATETSYGCGRDEFTADGDLKGTGTMYAVDGNGVCLTCDFSLIGEDLGDDRYTVDMDFDTCSCGSTGDRTATADCDMNSDGDRLICQLDFHACTPPGDNTFEKLN
jgi:hypothetical protein